MKFNIVKFDFFDDLNSNTDTLYTYCHKTVLKEFPNDNIIIFHSLEEIKEKYYIPDSPFFKVAKHFNDCGLICDYLRIYLSKYFDNMLYLDCDIEIIPGFREKLIEMSKEHDIFFGNYRTHLLYSKRRNDILNSLINEYDNFCEDLFLDYYYMVDNFQKKYNLQLNYFDLNSLKKHKYKYDLAIGIPVYSITKNKNHDEIINRLKEYICEIKKLFPNIKTQIIFSNNSKENINELKNIEDVEVVNNNCNLYAFKARKKAFEVSNAFYFWTIDDDDSINFNCDYHQLEKKIMQLINIKDKNMSTIICDATYYYEIYYNIVPSFIMQKIYDVIGDTNIKVYGEDILPYFALTTFSLQSNISSDKEIKFNFLNHQSQMFETEENIKKYRIDIDQFINYQKEKKRITPYCYKQSFLDDLKIYKNVFKFTISDIQKLYNFLKNY